MATGETSLPPSGHLAPGDAGIPVVPANGSHMLPRLEYEEKVLTRYATLVGDQGAIAHPIRTLKLFDDFCGGKVTDHVRRATFLNGLGEAIGSDDERGSIALSALKTYTHYVGEETPTWEKVSSLLTDVDEIEGFIAEGRYQLAGSNDEIQELLLAEGGKFISRYTWLSLALGGLATRDPDEIDTFMEKSVNVEPFLVLSADILDRLQNPTEGDHALFRDVFDVKTFYGPLNEPLRFDGLAMALQSVANITCLEKAGEVSVIAEAAEMLQPHQDRATVTRVVSRVYDELLGGFHVTGHSIDDTSQHGIILGASTLERDRHEAVIRAVWRLKGLGQLAVKMLKKPDMPINDIYGITLVTQDIDQLEDVFTSLLINIGASSVFQLADTPPGEEAVYVRGNETYRERIRERVAELKEFKGDEKLNYKIEERPNPSEEEFRVAKVQVVLKEKGYDRPIEIAVQTEEDRRRSRIGAKASHWGYKAGRKAAHRLDSIHQRVATMLEGKIVPESAKRGRKLRELVRNSPGLPTDWKTDRL